MKILCLALFLAIPALAAQKPIGGLGKGVVDAKIKERVEDIRDCYEPHLGANPKLAGRIAVHFIVGADGRISLAEARSSTFKDDAIKDCVLKVVKSLEFPKPEGGGFVDVDYPFAFSPARKP